MDKQAIRDRVWDALERAGVARFPFPPHDRIPNFAGAEAAADRLADRPEWARADPVKSNPDAPQLPVRRRALREGTVVYMAVPRLRDVRCFMALHPARIADTDAAATISSADEYAVQVGPEDMEPIDLIVAGSVAVTPQGDRIGKGEGYSDLEFAILSEAGLVSRETTIATTVHEMQLLDREFETDPHDVPMDLIVTPEQVIETDRRADRPAGIDWDALPAAKIDAIPILQQLRPEGA
jgi:5-formyltetrahydrofolate cyclo-ligase